MVSISLCHSLMYSVSLYRNSNPTCYWANKNVSAPRCTEQNYDKKSALDFVALLAKNRQAIRRLFEKTCLFTCQSRQCQCLNSLQWPLQKGSLGGAMR
jgi:hypothetical protein